ncbi:MAG: hypothetical protein IJ523_06655 [Succinivibrionaceae bacterium]|nr:hypothetical protein [Succinivibrionaceae bacterium]
MSEINKRVATDATLKEAVDALNLIAVAQAGAINVLSEKAIQQIVRAGLAARYFAYGEQVTEKWKQDDDHEYDYEQDVVAFHDVETALGETKPGLWLQSHWGLPGIQFDAAEALMYAVQAVAAGTSFHFTTSATLNDVPAGTYQFTLAEGLPAGGQATLVKNGTAWRIVTYSGPSSTTAIETVGCIAGSGGTDLGDIQSVSNTLMQVGKKASELPSGATVVVNHGSCTQHGYNRWSQSAIRQWLNSDAAIGAWWSAQNVFDRPPTQLATMRGFLAGLPADFLAIVQPVKVVTALNTVTDGGGNETTYDRFFLPSLEQEYIAPQVSGAEGAYWPYWKERLGLTSPQAQGTGGANAKHIRYAIENHTSSQHVRLRSAHRGVVNYAWYVGASGNAGSYNATHAYRPAPACVIC